MSKLETNTIDTVSGTTNLTIGSTNSSTVTFENGATTGHNYPSFLVNSTVTTNQSVSSGAATKVTFDREDHDTNSGWDSSNNKWVVPSNMAGRYVIVAGLGGHTGSNDLSAFQLLLRLNGSNIYTQQHQTPNKRHAEHSCAVVRSLSVGDYLELFGNATGTSPVFRKDFNSCWLGAYRIGA